MGIKQIQILTDPLREHSNLVNKLSNLYLCLISHYRDPLSYHRESWMMEKDEKLQTVPVLHMQGNALVRQKQFREAASKYKEAVLLLKTVQSREMPGDVDYINLGRMIVPLELNYCQCMLELEEYYEVIEHTTELLEKHKDCVKGYYKRAKAHAAVWNEKEARRDFSTVAQLDISLAALVRRELKELSERRCEVSVFMFVFSHHLVFSAFLRRLPVTKPAGRFRRFRLSQQIYCAGFEFHFC
uniref:Aryl hydrocarbon receptor interacting protein like 2 n=1 Tax=Poecilia latipinna TaxID=48699 RepID=A0A3B3U6K8_9TELE